MKNSPLISVVTVSYNAVTTIEQTILSVINQSYSNIEYIVIDGGSTDGTVDIIKKYADKITYWVSEPDKGIYDAMNKGIVVATGEWINFMNSGDLFYDNNVVDNILSACLDRKSDVIYGNRISSFSIACFIQYPQSLCRFSTEFPIFHQSCFIKMSIMKKMKYDLRYKICADYDFFYKLWKENGIYLYINMIISICDCEFGISSLAKNEIFRVKEGEIIRNGKLNMFSFLRLIKVGVVSCLRLLLIRIFPQFYNRKVLKKWMKNRYALKI